MNGILNVYKPKGLTSHAVVSRVRRFYGVKRVGHAGTLDPMACGVLPVLVGSAAAVQELVMDHDKVKTIRHISGLNIRVAHEVKGCADTLYSRCTRMGKLIPTLIISPPGCGKTTLLRDMIRKISDEGQTVGVVDERSEIGACYQGVAQNDLGIQTDVMDACEKGQGMNMLIRSMAPDVIAVDEIGSKEDVEALFFCAYRGCSILATAHGKNKESLSKNPYMREIINKKMFQRYVILEQRNQPGYIAQIMDENGVVLN